MQDVLKKEPKKVLDRYYSVNKQKDRDEIVGATPIWRMR
jgi:hypothetical protein